MSGRRAAAVGLAALALIAAGCDGGTSKEDYEKEIDERLSDTSDEFTQIARGVQASGSLENAAADIKKGADALDEAATELDDMEPPDDAEDAHAKIVEGIQALADDFRAAARAAATNNLQKVADLLGRFEASEGFEKLSQARDELKEAGYDVEG